MAFNWGSAGAGALGGAGTGASIGSVGGPIGMGIGALIGGIGGLFSGGYGGGSEDEMKNYELYSPEQKAAMNQMLQQGMQGYQGLQNNPLNFDPFEKQAMSQFNQQIVPGIAERFTNFAGGMGGQQSSAFGQQLGAAGGNLAENLAAMRANMAMQQRAQNMNLYGNMLNMGMQPQFGTTYQPGRPGVGGGMMNSMLSNLGPMASMMNKNGGFGGGGMGIGEANRLGDIYHANGLSMADRLGVNNPNNPYNPNLNMSWSANPRSA